ncbi:ATP-binding cassette domain-containing protein [Corynebacterium diphtheriae]
MVLKKLQFTYPKATEPSLSISHTELPQGQVIGVVGRNGAGKSTFVRVLTGLESKATGVVDINNRSLSGPRQRLRQSYLVMQDVNHQLFGESVESDVIIGTSGPDGKTKRALPRCLVHLISRTSGPGTDVAFGRRTPARGHRLSSPK